MTDNRALVLGSWNATVTSTDFTTGTLDNSTGIPAMGTADESGVGGVSWDPTLSVALPAQVVAGTYSGTITHSIA